MIRGIREPRFDCIKIDLKEVRSEGLDWIHVVQNRVQKRWGLVNMVVDFQNT
jgi:hypothetical protein